MRHANVQFFEHGPRREHIDPLEYLPPPARALIEDLKSEVRESCAMARSFYQQLDALAGKVARIKATRARNAELNQTLPRYVQADDPVDAALARQLAEAENETTRIERRLEQIEASQRPIGALVSRLEQYVAELTSPVAAIDPVTLKLGKGENAGQAVARIRGEIARLHEDHQAAIDAAIPSAVAKQIAAAHVRELAERGRPDVLSCLEGRSPPGFAMRERERIALRGAQAAAFAPSQPDTLALIAWLFEDVLVARLIDEIDRVAADDIALSDEARAARLAEIATRLLELERAEEAAIRLAATEGTKIQRRPDADLRAVLQLDPSTPREMRAYA